MGENAEVAGAVIRNEDGGEESKEESMTPAADQDERVE